MFLVAATEKSEKKKYTAVSITFQENFTPKAIALTNEDHAVKNKMETT